MSNLNITGQAYNIDPYFDSLTNTWVSLRIYMANDSNIVFTIHKEVAVKLAKKLDKILTEKEEELNE